MTKHAPAAPAPAPAAPAVDEGELVAVMMAAIAEESGMSPNSFRITNVSDAPVAAAPAPAPAPAAAPAPAPAPAAEPAPAPAAAPVSVGAGETPVNSPMPGSIFKVECTVGQSVHRRVHRRHRQHRRPAGDSGVKALSSPRERHCERQNSLSGYIRLCR